MIVEGVPREHIVATGIFYYDTTDNMVDEGLQFRRDIHSHEYRHFHQDYREPERPPPFDYSRNTIELGSIKTPNGRCVVFPNDHHHKVIRLSNKTNTPAVRKIACFFVVDPSYRILSTRDIPDQRIFRQKLLYANILQQHSLRLRREMLPRDIVEYILSFLITGMTLEEAKEHRLALMRQRKFYKNL